METIQSLQNPRVKNWVKLLSKKGRMKEGTFLIEGEHLVEEAVKAKAELVCIIIQSGLETKFSLIHNASVPIYLVTDAVLQKITDTETPQGICAIVRMAEHSLSEVLSQESLVLILDAIQDPGNLGTIIRTADAAGVSGIILGSGTVDIYNPKTIRSTMGSIFHIPFVEADLEGSLTVLKERGFKLVATSLEGSIPYNRPLYHGSVALVIGNEANGVSKDWLDAADVKIKIPIYGKAESLNAAIAAAITMYEAVRQRME
jgi:RNA methyltransferase, TrmH family